MVSEGAIFHPQIAGFNDSTLYPGVIAVRSTNAYVIDSINLNALYKFNTAKASVVDTLTITFTYGVPTTPGTDIYGSYFTNATVLANYGLTTTDSLHFASVRYDSITNTASGASKYTMKFYLTSAMWGDTSTGGIWSRTIPVPGPGGSGFAVPAGNIVGYAVTFKTGDATYVPNATIEDFTGAHVYNIFRPIYAFAGTSTVPVFAPYIHPAYDYNSGQFKRLPNYANGWGNVYVPMYAWTSGGAASTLQHSFYDIHVQCPTCSLTNNPPVVNAVNELTKDIISTNAFPNPASTELNIKFTTSAASGVTVNLVNTLGQVVATQSLDNTTGGSVTFNTAKLAGGVYYYTVLANGERATGHVLIAH